MIDLDSYPRCCLACGAIVHTFAVLGYCTTCRKETVTYQSTMTIRNHMEARRLLDSWRAGATP